MRPPHSADIKAVTTTVTTTTTTATTTTTTSKKTEKKTETQTETVTEPAQEEQPSAPQPAEPTEPDSSTNMSNRNLSAETSEMLGYVNEVRKQYGLRELEDLSFSTLRQMCERTNFWKIILMTDLTAIHTSQL